MNELRPILELVDVSVAAEPGRHAAMRGINLRLSPGAQAVVLLESGHEQTALADVAGGLVEPERGDVFFMGERWCAMSADRQNEMRGRIGRVFDRHGFVSNLTVLQNVVISQLHHTLRPPQTIAVEADALARAFGLPEVPKLRPAWAPARDLRRAEWVRALLGEPALLLLEHPAAGVPPQYAPALVAAVKAALQRGAAALWLVPAESAAAYTDLRGAARYVMKGEQMLPERG